MPNGISGDSSSGVILGGDPTENLMLIELRVLSNLMQNLLGNSNALDGLGELRNDQAFALGVPVPLPGTGL